MASSAPSEELPLPVDLSHYFSEAAKNKIANPFKTFYRFFQIPGIANFAGGLPNNNYFPFDTLEGVAAHPARFKPTPPKPVQPEPPATSNPDLGSHPKGSRVVVPKVSPDPNLLSKIDLKTALQYGDAHGIPPLYGWIRQFARENMHPNVPYKDGPEVILTTGNTDGFARSLEALMDPWRDGVDGIEKKPGLLVEQHLYTPPAIRAQSYNANIVPVTMDREGILADGEGGLEEVLANWDFSRGRRPHLLYTVTLGQNPTGGILGPKRRRELYKICVKYDVIIIEDEPYWYLQYPSANALSQEARGCPVSEDAQPGVQEYQSTGFPFLDSLVPSFLSIDYQGRVVRLDTFSKTIAPGCRLGWITAQPSLIEKIYLSIQQTTQQPSGFVQSMVAQLLMGTHTTLPPPTGNFFTSAPKIQSGWKVEGWVRWLEGLRGNYERRMNTMCKVLESNKYILKTGRKRRVASYKAELDGREADKHAIIDGDAEWRHVVKQDIYSFDYPLGGMFVWIRIAVEKHPLVNKFTPERLAAAQWILLTRAPYLVLAAPGALFSANKEIQANGGYAFMRLCFAAVEESEIAPLTHRFVNAIHAFWEIKDEKEIENLLDESPWLEAQAQLEAFTF